jgi:hypothetical protein
MTVFTSAKSTLTMPFCVMRSLMPLMAWYRTSSALRKASTKLSSSSPRREQLLVRDRDQRVDVLSEHGEAELGATRALLALEEEGLGHDADGQATLLPRELRDDRRGAGARAAAHAGAHEDHVGAGDDLLEALHVLERRLAALLGVGSRRRGLASRSRRCGSSSARGSHRGPARRC